MEFPRQMKDSVYEVLKEPTLDKFRDLLKNQTGEHDTIDFKAQWINKSKLKNLTPLLGSNSLGWFVDASAFGTVCAYFMVALSFILLRYKEPDLARPYYVKNGKLVGFIAVLVAGFFIVLY